MKKVIIVMRNLPKGFAAIIATVIAKLKEIGFPEDSIIIIEIDDTPQMGVIEMVNEQINGNIYDYIVLYSGKDLNDLPHEVAAGALDVELFHTMVCSAVQAKERSLQTKMIFPMFFGAILGLLEKDNEEIEKGEWWGVGPDSPLHALLTKKLKVLREKKA